MIRVEWWWFMAGGAFAQSLAVALPDTTVGSPRTIAIAIGAGLYLVAAIVHEYGGEHASLPPT